MPQMAPYNWLFMNLIFILTFLFLLIFLYFTNPLKFKLPSFATYAMLECMLFSKSIKIKW